MDLDWFPVLYYPRWELQVQLHPLRIKCSCFSWNNWAHCIYFMYWIHFPWLRWALTCRMLSNPGLSVWPRSTMWNVNDVLSQLDEKIWVILPACTTSEGVYYSSQRCYSVLFTLILHIWDSLVIRGRKSLRCYHNCSRAGRKLDTRR